MSDIIELLDREYNTTLSVPDEDVYLRAWVDRSAAARQQLHGHLDLAYGTGDKERLDLFPAPQSRQLIVFIHGGFWRGSDKSDVTWIAPSFVEAGISVAILNYGLCPVVTIETIVEQCRQGIGWLFHHTQEYGINADSMIIAGHSAGGHLGAMMFETDWSAYAVPDDAIGGGIALSGLFDLEPLTHTHINDSLHLDEQSARLLSPIHLKARIKKPLIAAVGALESGEFRRQSHLICESWPENCASPLILSGYHHFSILEAFLDLKSEIWRARPSLLAGRP